MAVIGERIVLRKRRSAGEPKPHRIKLDKLQPEDELVVEVVTDTKNDVRSWYRFKPADLAGRRSLLFRVSGENVYWLAGVMPQQILGVTAQRLAPELEAGQCKSMTGTVRPDGRRGKREPKNYKVLVFDASMRLKGIHPSLNDTARLYNLRAEAIDKLCKAKRSSQETGLSFRYWWKVLDFDITDFKLTVARYDELCKRKSADEELSGEE